MNFLLHRNYANDGSSRKRISLLTNRTNCSWSVNAPWRRLLPVPLNLLFIFFFFFKKKNKIKMTENETLPKQRLSTLWTSSRALSVLFSVWTNAPAPWHHFKRGEVRPRVQGHEVPIWAVHFIRPQMIAPISFSFKFLQNKIFFKKIWKCIWHFIWNEWGVLFANSTVWDTELSGGVFSSGHLCLRF